MALHLSLLLVLFLLEIFIEPGDKGSQRKDACYGKALLAGMQGANEF